MFRQPGQSAALRRRGALTSAPARLRDSRRYRKSNGVYYSWFVVLVALCEQALTDEAGVAPTNEQVAERTGFSVGNIEKKTAAIYEALEVDPINDKRPRDIAIKRAITNDIVTRDHLELLPGAASRRRIR